jgi:glutathione synthase/RimK-type ligase-like ATP-grasp enzyme
LAVVTNPGRRRARLFADAVRNAGLAPPVEIPWRALAAGRVPDIPAGALVRIDSPDGDADVDALLRGAAEPAGYGEILSGAAWYAGFVAALGRLAAVPDITLLNDPAELAVLFDKRRCHALLNGAGIAVPRALPPVTGYAALRQAMREAGFGRVFVKPPHGSSASGVIALETAGSRLVATTSVEVSGRRLYNSLTIRRYTDEATVAYIVDRLGEWHVERWFPKASHAGRTIDLRVVVVAGRPTHVVVRASRHPMTNLHLGARRGDVAAVCAAAGAANWSAAMKTCARAAALFPGCLQVGVDLMFGPRWRRHAVAEVNGFGDLLPGLLNGRGRDTYAEQVAACLTGKRAGDPVASARCTTQQHHQTTLCGGET